ncbi:hypothetical protein CTAM01_11391 [Colletotrichum tamarilloi]|uniref:Uncharacterized protein n=1 Tax=Colletotrichum tamarilloi TaxID=1209934 RepID=A0ABQ9QXT4_9PEZI|nr:uncharacterized protein CTAM01_11391 [Colletotrichum tamarilloi]KAK1488910.1 hypothetical protein CTAM01_11391 [Colletotrichum tamarilloi]
MMRLPSIAGAVLLLLLRAVPIVYAQSASSCTAVPAVASCVSSITSLVSRTASVSKFCSSVLECPLPTTTTLVGTVSTTTTKTRTSTYTLEEIGTETTTTSTFSYTESTYSYIATETVRPTWTVERFEVTTAKPKQRREAMNHLEVRAVTSVCSLAVQKSACSCLYTCPGPVIKDSRKTIKSIETEISWVVTTSFIAYTNIEYYPIITAEVSLPTSTVTQAEIATHTRNIKCTPSASDPSFYLLATVAPVPTPVPVYNDKYVLANPQFELFTENGVLFEPQYTPDKGTASVFILDSKGRIVTQTSYGDHFFASDDYNDFELMHILPRGWIQARRGHNGEDAGFDYVYCTMQPPSGRYVGGFKELACTQGYFNATVLQYCPLYDEYFHTGTVLGAEYSATTPDCLLVTYLVVPVC